MRPTRPKSFAGTLRNIAASLILFLCLVPVASARAATGPQDGKTVVTGVIYDEDRIPVAGANIMVKGTDTGTIADGDGKFSITVPYSEATLIISFIGFTTMEYPLAGKANINVTLKAEAVSLEETVVIGYGSQKRATMTGSISSVNVKDLTQSPSANVTNALAGRLPGLTVTQFGGGEPGKDQASFAVRGISSYTSGAQSPIVIVDGVERSLSSLDPNEIETFSILKDASATAVYGIRGANGVIIVTTKRGAPQEKPTVEFKAQVGIAEPVSYPDYLGSADYARLSTTRPSRMTIRTGRQMLTCSPRCTPSR